LKSLKIFLFGNHAIFFFGQWRPGVAIFDSAIQDWRYENEYPLARTEWAKLYLRSIPSGPASEPPEREEPDNYMIPQSFDLVAAGKPVLAYATATLENYVRV
jgi:predicted acyl esterase